MTLVHTAGTVNDTVTAVSPQDRMASLHAVERLLTHEPGRIRRILTEVTTHRAAEYELGAARSALAGAGTEIATHRPGRVPRAAVFMPGNVLLYSYVLYLLVPSLFTDHLCFRPARDVRDTALALHHALAPVHELPVEPMLTSQREFVREGVATADLVVFTGAYQNAERLRPQLRPDQLFCYLGGGINPFVVAPGADLAAAVDGALAVRLLNSGQDCLAPDVFFVHASVLDDFVSRLVTALSGLRYGPVADPSADYGPAVYDSALEHAAQYLFRHQDAITHGGRVDFRTRWVEPSVLVTREFDRHLGRAEMFAPIFNVVGYDDEDRLRQLLCSGRFAERAMGATVYGRAEQLVSALAERHMVTVDETLLAADDGNAPFGGRGPMANYIAHRGRLTVEPVLLSKAVADHLATQALGGAA